MGSPMPVFQSTVVWNRSEDVVTVCAAVSLEVVRTLLHSSRTETVRGKFQRPTRSGVPKAMAVWRLSCRRLSNAPGPMGTPTAFPPCWVIWLVSEKLGDQVTSCEIAIGLGEKVIVGNDAVTC